MTSHYSPTHRGLGDFATAGCVYVLLGGCGPITLPDKWGTLLSRLRSFIDTLPKQARSEKCSRPSMKPQTFGLDTSHVPLAKLTCSTTALFFLTEVVEISVKEPRIKVDAEEPNPTRLLKALFMCGESDLVLSASEGGTFVRFWGEVTVRSVPVPGVYAWCQLFSRQMAVYTVLPEHLQQGGRQGGGRDRRPLL